MIYHFSWLCGFGWGSATVGYIGGSLASLLTCLGVAPPYASLFFLLAPAGYPSHVLTMGKQRGRKAWRNLHGLLRPKFRTGILSLLPYSIGQSKLYCRVQPQSERTLQSYTARGMDIRRGDKLGPVMQFTLPCSSIGMNEHSGDYRNKILILS